MARWRGLTGGLGFAFLALSDMAASAQTAAAPTPLDGSYAGTATETSRGRKGAAAGTYCWPISSVQMTVAAGRVSIRETRDGASALALEGSVTPAGEVSASNIRDTQGFTITGTIRGNAFTGEQSGALHRCNYQLEMAKR